MMNDTPQTAIDAILAALDPVARKSVLDIGCGAGGTRRRLTEAGALWHGVDPAAPEGDGFTTGVAEALPFADATYDAAICLNALHHVPSAAMDAALTEAGRVLKPEGCLIVVEPDADGPLSRVLAVIDDETEIRTAAQDALDRCDLPQIEDYRFLRHEGYADFAAFTDSLVAVDPARAAMIAANENALRARFDALSFFPETGADPVLAQPMHVRVFAKDRPR